MSAAAKVIPQIIKVIQKAGKVNMNLQRELVKNLPPLGEHPAHDIIYSRSWTPQAVSQGRWIRRYNN